MKNGKSQIGINLGDKPNEFIGSVCTRTSVIFACWNFAIVLKPKDNNTQNSSGEMERLQMNPP